jgi:hypothetical protein
MARRAPQPALSPKMLRHFAVATAALTACLALFADGEGRNEFGQSVAVREREAAAAVAAAGEKVKPKFSLNSQIRDARRTYVPFAGDDGDSGAGYGAPMDSAAGSDGGSSNPGGGYSGPPVSASREESRETARGPLIPGPIKAQLGDQGSAPPPGRRPPAVRRPSQQELDQLEAKSMQRSGAS